MPRPAAAISQITHALIAPHIMLRARPFSGSLRDQRARELVGVERAQVLERLAHADQLHRQAELARDRHRDTPARGAVELRYHHSGNLRRLRELLRLAQAVLP